MCRLYFILIEMENFTDLLKQQIKERRIAGLSREMGVSRTAVYKWLNGTQPLLKNYIKLLELSQK